MMYDITRFRRFFKPAFKKNKRKTAIWGPFGAGY